MKAIAAVLFAVSLLHPSLSYSTEFESSTATVAAWNLEGRFPIPATRLELQAEGIALLDAEVLTLIEVNPDSAMANLKTLLADDFDLCYDFEILPQTSIQNIAVMVKCGITTANPRFIDNSNIGDNSLRKAFVVDITVGEFDFMLIALHLKSARGATEQGIRDQQTQVIGEFITDFRTNNPRDDILLVGDFNMIPGQDVSNFHFLGGADEMDFISSWDLQGRFTHRLPTGTANLLDGYAITRTFTTEYIRGSLRVFPMHLAMKIGLNEFKETVSDHLPLVASFKINRDAD